jgi:hypothetical protein
MRKIEYINFKGNKYNMDDKSTPIESLNRNDDSEVVNQILNKYNNLGNTDDTIPSMNPNIPEMENKFENRNLNKEMFEHNSNNVVYKDHYENELKRTNQFNSKKNIQEQNDYDDEDEYDEDEYEVVEIPLWRRVLNEIRIPLFIFIFIIIFSNCSFDKLLIKRVPLLGNEFNECNTYGFLLKAFLISVFSYILIKFIRF